MKVSAACAGTSGISGSSSSIFERAIFPLSILIRIKSSVSFLTEENRKTDNVHVFLFLLNTQEYYHLLKERFKNKDKNKPSELLTNYILYIAVFLLIK